ncbi:MAG TPA: pilus assembly protein TadG-related protein [Chloroflexota bacterium]|nr:pilus assembly protein TadG-related protein [Chloroflexota bacterium]
MFRKIIVDVARRWWRQAAAENGAFVVMFGLMLPVLVGMVGIGLDGAHLFAVKRQIQSTADLSALDGARSLPNAPATAITRALNVSSDNGFTHGVDQTVVDVVTPHESNTRQIEVTIRTTQPTWSLRILGIEENDVVARAVAYRLPVGYAIFADYGNCADSDAYKSIDWSGSSATVVGSVHSNSGILMGGSNNTIGDGTGETTYACSATISGSGNVFNPPRAQTGPEPIPYNFTNASFPCTYSANELDLNSDGDWWVSNSTKTELKPGVYCATGSDKAVKLSGSDVSGNVTFVAQGSNGLIDISGSNFNLTPFMHGVLAYTPSTQNPAIKMAGSGGTWSGIIFAPNGQVEISGSSNFSLDGQLIAKTVKLGGSGWSLTYDGSSLFDTRLLE